MPAKRLAVVFCGSSSRILSEYLDLADQVGYLLGRLKLGLVFGAGTNGMMGKGRAGSFRQQSPDYGDHSEVPQRARAHAGLSH